MRPASNTSEEWTEVDAGDPETSSTASGLTDVLIENAAFKIQQSFRDHKAKHSFGPPLHSKPPHEELTEAPVTPTQKAYELRSSSFNIASMQRTLFLAFLFGSLLWRNTGIQEPAPRMLFLAAPPPPSPLPIALLGWREDTLGEGGSAITFHAHQSDAADLVPSFGTIVGLLTALVALSNLCGQRGGSRAALIGEAPAIQSDDDGGDDGPKRKAPATVVTQAPFRTSLTPMSHKAQRWNAFQRRAGGCGLQQKALSALYAQLQPRCATSADDPATRLLESSRSWNGFQREVAGCGLTKAQMSSLYKKMRGELQLAPVVE